MGRQFAASPYIAGVGSHDKTALQRAVGNKLDLSSFCRLRFIEFRCT